MAWKEVERVTFGRVKRPPLSESVGPSKFVLEPEDGVANSHPVLVSYDEWRPRQHIHVATFSDGRYQIEIHGAWMSGRMRRTEKQNGFFNGAQYGRTVHRAYLKSIKAQGGTRLPSCHELEGASKCVLRTEVTAMNADVSGYRASWISEKCAGYPSAMADAAWDLVERVTQGEIRRDWGVCTGLTDCPEPPLP